MAVLGRLGEAGTAGPVGRGVGEAWCGTGERLARHDVATPGDQEFGACADEGRSAVVVPGRAEVDQICVGARVVGGQAPQQGPGLQRCVGGEVQRPREDDFVQSGDGVVECVHREGDTAAVLPRCGPELGDPHLRQGDGGPIRQCSEEADVSRAEQRGRGRQVERQGAQHNRSSTGGQCGARLGQRGVRRVDAVGQDDAVGSGQDEGRLGARRRGHVGTHGCG